MIGADADHYIDGGGSGAIQYPAQLTTILDGITDRAGTDVTYARGTDAVSLSGTLPGPVPVPSSVLRPSSGDDADGLSAFYFLGVGLPRRAVAHPHRAAGELPQRHLDGHDQHVAGAEPRRAVRRRSRSPWCGAAR